MDSVPGRAKRLESVISICILAILFLIGLRILIKQFDYDMSRFGISADSQRLLKKIVVSEDDWVSYVLIMSTAGEGFEPLGETEIYNPDNLYEKINGKAPLYIDSGFKKLSTHRFASQDGENMVMEIYAYDMGTVKNAFSVYSVQTRAEVKFLPDFAFAYTTSNALYLVHGKYYIELIGFVESQQLIDAMVAVAQHVQTGLRVDTNAKITELALFPQQDIVLGSIKLYLANAFGFEDMTDTFTARYKLGDETVSAFLSRRSNTKEAQLTAESYYNFLINNGGVAKQTGNKILEGKIVDFYDTTEIVFATGPFVGGIHEAENQQAAEKLAEILIKKLNEAANSIINNE